MIISVTTVNKNPLIHLLISSLISTQVLSIPQRAIASPLNHSQTVMGQNINQLTEEKVLAIMEIIEKAEEKEDISTILNFLAPFVVSSVTVDTKDATVTRNLEGKKAHDDFLQNNFNLVKDEELIDSYTTVSMSEDEQVLTVTRLRITNVVTEDAREFLSSSNDLIRFALIDDQPMIVSITIKGWLEERPSQ